MNSIGALLSRFGQLGPCCPDQSGRSAPSGSFGYEAAASVSHRQGRHSIRAPAPHAPMRPRLFSGEALHQQPAACATAGEEQTPAIFPVSFLELRSRLSAQQLLSSCSHGLKQLALSLFRPCMSQTKVRARVRARLRRRLSGHRRELSLS